MLYTDILKVAGAVIFKNLVPNKKWMEFLKHMGVTLKKPVNKVIDLEKKNPVIAPKVTPIALKKHLNKSFTPKILT